MDCLIKENLSYLIGNIIKTLIEDVNGYSHLITTDDWQLMVSLNDALKHHGICERQCSGCLDFFSSASALANFSKGILDANGKSETIISELCGVFGIKKERHPIILALDLVAAPDYVKSKISVNSFPNYMEYVNSIKGEVTRLALAYWLNEQTKHSDAVLSHAHLEQEQVIAYTIIENPDNEEIFYLDQNVISKLTNDSNLRVQIENFKAKKDCRFVYSPFVIEDGVKMSRVRLAEYFDTIEALTEGTMIVRTKDGVVFAKEDIKITSERVFLWRNATRAAEDVKISKMHYRKWGYPHYSRDSRWSRRANENIGEFLESLRPYLNDRSVGLYFEDFESDHALCRRLSAATIEKSFSLEDLVDRSIKYESEEECVEHIGDLCDFLDLINYRTEPLSDVNKIRSSLQDTEHLKHAWKSDYFVTDDERLRARGEFIYSVLGLKAKFIKINDLRGMVARAFKAAEI